MIKECPFCGSIRIVETLKGDTSICLACESLLKDKNKPIVFDRIRGPGGAGSALCFPESVVSNKYQSATTMDFYTYRRSLSDKIRSHRRNRGTTKRGVR